MTPTEGLMIADGVPAFRSRVATCSWSLCCVNALKELKCCGGRGRTPFSKSYHACC
jgi:hypothetical protein